MIISKILNKTDLAQSGSHGGLVIYKHDRELLINFFEQTKVTQTFVDKDGGEEFQLRYANYTSNNTTPNDRITSIDRYASKHKLLPGDILVLEKNTFKGLTKYYLEYARKIKSIFFAGKSSKSAEILNTEQFTKIITQNVAEGNINCIINNSYEMDVIYEGQKGSLLLIQNDQKIEMYFESAHIEENKKYYELDTSFVPFELRKMSTWNVEVIIDDEVIKDNERADQQLITSIEVEDLEIDLEAYIPKPEVKSEKKEYGSGKVASRNKTIAGKALKRADFLCEANPEHESFLRKIPRVNYTEPHHIIPLQFDDEFEYSLDVQANIISLCSNCHNEIHYGADARTLLVALWNKRKKEIFSAGIGIMKNGASVDINILLSFYGIK